MSRIYRALEKVEKDKQQKTEGVSFYANLEKELLSKEDGPILKSSHGTEGEWDQRIREEIPVLSAVPSSFAVEQFRKLKTHIFLGFNNPPHFFLITSSIRGEGKTTVARNLAIAISHELDRNAVLIEADLRKPGNGLGGQQNSKSLSDYLEGHINLSDLLRNSENGKPWVIPAGKSSAKATEMIGSKKMEELLVSMRSLAKNAYVIIDSPPILSAAEPILLAKMVDGVIVVVLAGETPKAVVRRSVQAIGHQRIIGVIFNKKNLKPSRRYGGSDGYYYHYYSKK